MSPAALFEVNAIPGFVIQSVLMVQRVCPGFSSEGFMVAYGGLCQCMMIHDGQRWSILVLW